MTHKKTTSNARAYMILLFLALLFFGPIITAWSLYQSKNFEPDMINTGHLIQPPLSLKKLTLYDTEGHLLNTNVFYGIWSFVYINPGQCTKICRDNLYKIRQVRKALGKDQDRVQRIILTLKSQNDHTASLEKLLNDAYVGTLHIMAPRKQLTHFLTSLPSKSLALKEGYLYLVDPLGNVMMSYQSSEKPRGIYNDIRRLLKASQLG